MPVLDRADALAFVIVLDARMDYATGLSGSVALGFDSGSVALAARTHTGDEFIAPYLLRRIKRCEEQILELYRAERESSREPPGPAN